MKSKIIATLSVILFFCFSTFSQAPKVWKSGETYEAIKKLNFLGSVLYVAAHPDDENTRLISYFSNHIKARTTYLSLTRGGGGQNLIGSEIKDLLGMIRTQELLAARRIDGGHQMFSRAIDFGYSKNPEETLNIWDKDKVMSDVIWAIRKTRPDVIINRFDHTRGGKTHGHHTSSAILSYDAFDISGDLSVYPEQLSHVKPYKAKRLFYNTSWWRYGGREAFAKVDKSDMAVIDIGKYYPILGKSNSEIAAESRSQHKCQGMGNTASREASSEYLQILKGDFPKSNDVFEGINTTWSRINGGAGITAMIDQVIDDYDFTNPSLSIPALLEVYNKINMLDDDHWKPIKLVEIKNIIEACMGLYLEAVTAHHTYSPGDDIQIKFESTNRSSFPLFLEAIKIPAIGFDTLMNQELKINSPLVFNKSVSTPKSLPYSSPYWLVNEGKLGVYNVPNQKQIGQPETQREIIAQFHFNIGGEKITIYKEIAYKYNSPEDGPVYRPLEITPELYISVPEKVVIFQKGSSKEIKVAVKSGASDQVGKLILPLPEGWTSTPSLYEFEIKEKGDERLFTFNISPPASQSEFILTPIIEANGKEYNMEMISIDYDHIPFQSVLIKAKSKMVNLDIEIMGNKIGYIAGSGDDIPSSLRQVGYQVDMIDLSDVSESMLSKYHAVVMGIRAYNKWDELKFKHAELLKYVNSGGTLMIQYNTAFRLKVDNMGPYPLKISRDRVTVEEAPIEILAPQHPVMNTPNKITSEDFEGWVQERGLYFPGEWDENYTAILSCNDPGEPARKGGLLIAPYGDGWYIYTGYSWFRELPAGVPGAFRIFANMLSLGNNLRP